MDDVVAVACDDGRLGRRQACMTPMPRLRSGMRCKTSQAHLVQTGNAVSQECRDAGDIVQTATGRAGLLVVRANIGG